VLLLSFAACGKEPAEPTTVPVSSGVFDTTAEATTAALTTETPSTETPSTEAPTTAAPTTAAPTTAAPTTVAPTTAAPVPTTAKPAPTTAKPAPTTAKPAPTTAKPTTTQKKVTVPTTKQEIVALYNAATATAASAKPGYSKKTNTVLSDLDFGALGRMKLVRDAVGGFLGEGQSSQTVARGKFDGKSLKKSTLTAADVTSATCTLSKDGKYYDLTLTLKTENNPQKGSSVIGKVTDDYKGVNELKSGIQDAGASVGSISTKTQNVTVKARISVDGKRFVSLTHSFVMTASLTNVKYTLVTVKSGSGKLTTTVTYSDFKY
jgi:hypothetical protein